MNMNNHQEENNNAEVVMAPTPPIITSASSPSSSSSVSVSSVVLSSPQQFHQPKYAVAGPGGVITSATIRDVLNGRGQGVQRHPGNVKYRTLVFVNKVCDENFKIMMIVLENVGDGGWWGDDYAASPARRPPPPPPRMHVVG